MASGAGQLVGFALVRGYRFFHQDVQSTIQQPTTDWSMIDGRDSYADRLSPCGNCFETFENLDAEICRHGLGAFPVGIEDADEFGLFERCVNAGVLPAEVTHTDDCHADPVVHNSIPV